MRKLIILCSSCLFALLYPCAELFCWDTAGNRIGSWVEISCDGISYSGAWTGDVTSDCRFVGKNVWESVTGEINPSSKILTASGISPDGCGMINMTGLFSSDLVSVSGTYVYSEGGGGSFSGTIHPK
jgi:hypothetical protein